MELWDKSNYDRGMRLISTNRLFNYVFFFVITVTATDSELKRWLKEKLIEEAETVKKVTFKVFTCSANTIPYYRNWVLKSQYLSEIKTV